MSSFRLSAHNLEEPSNDPRIDEEESSSEDEDDTWEDWESDSLAKQPCRSLFDDSTLPSATETIEYDKKTHDFDLNATYASLSTQPNILPSLQPSAHMLLSVGRAPKNTTSELDPQRG